MTTNRALSLVHLLVLVLTLMCLAHGKAIKQKRVREARNEKTSDNCPSQEECKSPDCVNVSLKLISDKLADIQRPHDVRNRSTSPWDYRINEDLHRIPSVIFQASCRHLTCLNFQGLPDGSMNSVPIQQEILVIKRKLTGCPHYWVEKEMVTVGCTCAVPITYPSSG